MSFSLNLKKYFDLLFKTKSRIVLFFFCTWMPPSTLYVLIEESTPDKLLRIFIKWNEINKFLSAIYMSKACPYFNDEHFRSPFLNTLRSH